MNEEQQQYFREIKNSDELTRWAGIQGLAGHPLIMEKWWQLLYTEWGVELPVEGARTQGNAASNATFEDDRRMGHNTVATHEGSATITKPDRLAGVETPTKRARTGSSSRFQPYTRKPAQCRDEDINVARNSPNTSSVQSKERPLQNVIHSYCNNEATPRKRPRSPMNDSDRDQPKKKVSQYGGLDVSPPHNDPAYQLQKKGEKLIKKFGAREVTYNVKFNEAWQGKHLKDLVQDLNNMFDDVLDQARGL
jgi:hypothetical protein